MRADRAVQPAVDNNQGELVRSLVGQSPVATTNQRHREVWHHLSWNERNLSHGVSCKVISWRIDERSMNTIPIAVTVPIGSNRPIDIEPHPSEGRVG